MWASPDNYSHVATREVREVRVTLNNPVDIDRFDAQKPDVAQVLASYLEANETKPLTSLKDDGE